jgi:hypothetical protein
MPSLNLDAKEQMRPLGIVSVCIRMVASWVVVKQVQVCQNSLCIVPKVSYFINCMFMTRNATKVSSNRSNIDILLKCKT